MIDKLCRRKSRYKREQRYRPIASGSILNGKEGEMWGGGKLKGSVYSVSNKKVEESSKENYGKSVFRFRKLEKKELKLSIFALRRLKEEGHLLRDLLCSLCSPLRLRSCFLVGFLDIDFWVIVSGYFVIICIFVFQLLPHLLLRYGLYSPQLFPLTQYLFKRLTRHPLRHCSCLLGCFLVCHLLCYFLRLSLRFLCRHIAQLLLGYYSRHHLHLYSQRSLHLLLCYWVLRQYFSPLFQSRYIRFFFRHLLRHFFWNSKQNMFRRLLYHSWCIMSYFMYLICCPISYLRQLLRLLSRYYRWSLFYCLYCLLWSLPFQYSLTRYLLRHLLRYLIQYICIYFFQNNKRYSFCRSLHHSLCRLLYYLHLIFCSSSNFRLSLRLLLRYNCWFYLRKCVYLLYWYSLPNVLRRRLCYILHHYLQYYCVVVNYHRLLLKVVRYYHCHPLRQGSWYYRWNLQEQNVRHTCYLLHHLFQCRFCHCRRQHLHQFQRLHRLHHPRYPLRHLLRHFLWHLWCGGLCQLLLYLLCVWCKLSCYLCCSVGNYALQFQLDNFSLLPLYSQAYSPLRSCYSSSRNIHFRSLCQYVCHQLYCLSYSRQQVYSYLTWNIVCVKLHYKYLLRLLRSLQLQCNDSFLCISWILCCHLLLQTLCCDYYYCRYYSKLVDNSQLVLSLLGSQTKSQNLQCYHYLGFFLYFLRYCLSNLLRYKLCISGRYLLCIFSSYICSLCSYLSSLSYSFFVQISCCYIHQRVCGVWWRSNQLNKGNGDVEWIYMWIVELMWVCLNGRGERVDCNIKLKKYVSKYCSVKKNRKKESTKVDYQLEEKERERTANRGMEREKYRQGGSNKQLSNLGKFISNKRRYIRKKKDRIEQKRIKQLIIELVRKNSKADREIEDKEKLKVGDIRDSTLRINGKYIKHRGNTLECIGELILIVGLRQDRRKIRTLYRDWTKYPEVYSWKERYEKLSELNKMVKLRVSKRGDLISMGHFLLTEVEQHSRVQMKYLTIKLSNEIKGGVEKGDVLKLSWGFFGNSLEELGHNDYFKKVDTLLIYSPESPGCFNSLTLGQMITSGLEEFHPLKTMTIGSLNTTSVCDSGFSQWNQPEIRWDENKYVKVNHSSVVRKEYQKTTITGHTRSILRRSGSNIKYNIRIKNIVTIGEKVREQRNKEEGISEVTLYGIREQIYTVYRDRMLRDKEKSGRINKWGKPYYKVKRNIREGNGVDKERWHRVKYVKEDKNSILYINKRVENLKNRIKEKGMYIPDVRVIQRVYLRKSDKAKVRKFRLLWVVILPFNGYRRWHMAQMLRGCCPYKADIRLDRYDRYREEMLEPGALYQAAKGNYKGRKIRYACRNNGLTKWEGKRNTIQEGKWKEEEHISRKGRSKLRLTQGWGMYVNRLYGGRNEECNWKSKRDKKEK